MSKDLHSAGAPGADRCSDQAAGATMVDAQASLLCFVVPDEAMEPRARPGQFAYFDPDLSPRAGDGVLVVDADDRAYFRLFRPGHSPGQWCAVPVNPRFTELAGDRLGLRVIGVYVGLRGRFADDLAAQASAQTAQGAA